MVPPQADKRRYKAKPKCERYAIVGTELTPTLALWGLQRVRRRSRVSKTKRTHPREWGKQRWPQGDS